jgi:hypothetical protein
MKTGKTLQEMAVELERQSKAKRDFISPTGELELIAGRDTEGLRVNGHGTFGVGELGHEQIASRVGIPQKYYDRMRKDAPEMLEQNVNGWFKREPEKRMVRTLDNKVRAFLSDRYRPLDNFDLADVAFNTLIQNKVKIESTELTERRLYIKAVTETLSLEVKKGDIVQAGIVISNSEVGCGSVKVEPMVFRLVCTNGLIANDHAMRKYHVGRAGSEGDFASEFFKDETRRADDKAFWLKVRDVIQGAFQRDVFEKIVAHMKIAAHSPITGNIESVIELTQEKFGLNDDERSGVLKHLIQGADLTQWGLVNAITRTSQDVPDYDRATDLERLGGVVLELPNKDWKVISEAA